jgi:hypothetical protein
MYILRKWRLVIICIVVIGMAPLITGCYGHFPITHAIYKANGDVSSYSLVKTIVFWVFLIVPVYAIGFLGDIFIFNLIEFWTGSAPLDPVTMTDREGNTVTLAPAENGRDAVLTVSRDGQVLAEERFIRVSDTEIEVRDARNQLNGKVIRSGEGHLLFVDAEGRPYGTLSSQSIAARRARSR